MSSFCHNSKSAKKFSAPFIQSTATPLFFDLEQHKPTAKQSQFAETSLCDNSMAVQLSTSFFRKLVFLSSMRFFNRQGLCQHRRASTSSIFPKLGISSFCLFLLFSLPLLLPEKATADAVFINFPAFFGENSSFSSSNVDGSASGSSFSGNLIRIGAFSGNPTTLIGGLTAITTPSAILANLESKFTQYTSFTFSDTLLSPDTPIYPTTDPDTGVPLVAQPSISASLRGQDIYLLFYNAATTGAADQLAIFRMKDSAMNGSTGSDLAGIFSTATGADGQYTSSFNLYTSEADMLLGQYISSSGTFVLGKLSGGVGQITSATTKSMNAGSDSTYQILSNNGADTYALSSPHPSWASINAATGIISLSPASNISGPFTLTFTASNSLTGNTATGSLTVTVQTTTGPAFTSSTAVAAIVGIAFSHTITTDAPATFTAPSLPAELILDSATGVLSGIPRNAVPVNIEIVAARVSNPTQTSTQNLTLTVSSPTLAIAALVSGQLTRTAGTAYTIPVTIPAGFTVDSSSITPAISGVTFSAGNLLISSTAAPFAKGTTSQAVTLTLNRTSGLGGSTVSASLNFDLRLVAPAPTALTTAGPFEVNVGEDYSLQLATDVSTICPNQNIAVVGTLPTDLINNSAGLRKTGSITGKNTSTTLPWEFPVNVVVDTSTFYEGGGTLTVPVIFRLRNSIAPVITSSTRKLASVGKAFVTYPITATGNPSQFEALGLPQGLSLTGNNINGTPAQAGQYTVTLKAFNSYRPGSTLPTDLQEGTGTLQIFISSDKPSTSTQLNNLGNLQVGTALPAQGVHLINQAGTSVACTGLPKGLVINYATGMVTGTPTIAGTFLVNAYLQNGSGWIKKTITLTVR